MSATTEQHFDTGIRNNRTAIDTGRGVIGFTSRNGLDDQICQAIKACIENPKVNDVKFLQHLEAINNGSIKI